MKTIGLLGGMSWESSVYYYTVINKLVNQRLGGYSSAKIILNSIDFDPIEQLQSKDDWNQLNSIMCHESKKIEDAGADIILICTNTMHNCYNNVCKALSIPVLHIADSTGANIKENGLNKIGLLGTIYTMEKMFYKGRLRDRFNLDVSVPGKQDRIIINQIIFDELVFGKFTLESKEKFKLIMMKMIENGAEGIILGCTEIPLLIKKEDVSVPIFDTSYIHAKAAVDFALDS